MEIFGINKPKKIEDDKGNIIAESRNQIENSGWFWDESNNVLEIGQGFKKVSICL